MTFDMKAWKEANREKIKLYSVRARLKKKGLPSPETTEQMMAERAAKKAASAERAKQRKREWAAANKRARTRGIGSAIIATPEFRRREIDKRMAAFQPKMTEEERAAKKAARELAKQATKESRQRAREEEKLKKKKLENARRHALAMERAAKIAPKPKKVTMNTRKPGRLVALAGWMGW